MAGSGTTSRVPKSADVSSFSSKIEPLPWHPSIKTGNMRALYDSKLTKRPTPKKGLKKDTTSCYNAKSHTTYE
ncbi:hypothetical protein GUJ93_ZPchr0003g16905 [Zizania palustris]|uniref:Uncharacterized protein n=1 Tax=Zizania palustris TaxID=103762 RepID=A0A8J5RKG0_ZIZPA|nr:hypothetical protein GUJ93_ZPchr0003g16905 [Zizania palustris]